MKRRTLLSLLLCVIAISTVAFADEGHDRTQFGHDIVVGPNDEISEATCFGCSVRVRGRVAGDVTTFGGSVVVEDNGEIAGDTVAFGGDLRLSSGVTLDGDVAVFGGRLRRAPEAKIHGDIADFGGPLWLLLIIGLPFVVLGAFVALIVWLVRRLLRPPIRATA